MTQLWDEDREALIEAPFDVLTPMGGSFNFDPRGAWTAIDAGYSPNDQDDRVVASPVVEFSPLGASSMRAPRSDGSYSVLLVIFGESLCRPRPVR